MRNRLRRILHRNVDMRRHRVSLVVVGRQEDPIRAVVERQSLETQQTKTQREIVTVLNYVKLSIVWR